MLPLCKRHHIAYLHRFIVPEAIAVVCALLERVLYRPTNRGKMQANFISRFCAGVMTSDSCRLHIQSAAGKGYLSHLPAASISASLFGGFAIILSALWGTFTSSPFTTFGNAELPLLRFSTSGNPRWLSGLVLLVLQAYDTTACSARHD